MGQVSMPALAPLPVSTEKSSALPAIAPDSVDRPRPDVLLTDFVYAAVAPIAFAGVHLAARCLGASPAELRQRSGHLAYAPGPLLWFHGASAGEITAAIHLVHALRAAGFAFHAGYTATNGAGIAVARHAMQSHDQVALAPWDAPRAVARALDAWQPRALFLIETELWPRLVFDATRRGVPVFSASARIYPRDVRRYQSVRPFIAPTVRRLTRILTKDERERSRFVRLGAAIERCVVAGDLKHAAPPPAADAAASLRAELGVSSEEAVVVCGSVHADEVSLLLGVLTRLNARRVRVVVAPRHDQATARVLAETRQLGWRAHRRSDGTPPADWRLLVWDTYGELRRAYAIATVAIVAGSFASHGGHNLLEPVQAGAPVLFGADVSHGGDDARRLTALTPEACVRDADDLAARLSSWLSDPQRRRDAWERQCGALPDGQGIANRYVAVLSPWLREMGLKPA
jgi:3-deoxy-D-manno-octulosonic-acid transferase